MPNVKYITSLTAGGLTNAFISHVNLIYVAILAGRVPALAPFITVHVDQELGVITVSDIFDLDHLSKAIHIPILEWSQIKDFSAGIRDDISCWSTQETLAGHFHWHEGWDTQLHLNMTFTPIPEAARLLTHTVDYFANYMGLASLSFPETRRKALEEAKRKKPTDRPGPPPDEHMMCFDLLYYAAATTPFEWETEFTPAWHLVGTHMRWNRRMLDATKGIVSRALGFRAADQLPPIITVHVRRSDFRLSCPKTVKECLPPLSVYARQVNSVKDELFRTQGLEVDHVLVTSDESDDRFWADVAKQGWYRIDHVTERSAALYGAWFVPVIDVIAQSLGIGCVGTDHSTMSTVAMKRVVDWNGGVVRKVVWDPYNPGL